MSETVGRAEYELGVDMKPLKKGLSDAEGAIKKSGTAAEQAFSRKGTAAANKMATAQGQLVKQSSALSKGVLAGVGIGGGILAFTALESAVSGVVGFLGDSVRAAKEEEVGIAQLTASLKANVEGWDGNRDSIEEVISARERLAFNDDEQRQSLALLLAATHDVTEAQRLQAIAMDLSRLRGTALVETTTLVGKVAQGNLTALKRFGISLGNVSTAEEALNKIQALSAGQASAFANTLEGKATRATQAWNNAMEDLGNTVTPLAADLALFASEAIPAIARAIGGLGSAFNDLNRLIHPDVGLTQDMIASSADLAKVLGLEESAVRGAIEAHLAQSKAIEDATRIREESLVPYRDQIERGKEQIRVLREQGKSWDYVTDQLAKAYGLTVQQVGVVAGHSHGVQNLVENLVLLSTEQERLNDGIEGNTTAYEEANKVARDYLGGLIAISGPANQLVNTTEENTQAAIEQREAMQGAAKASREGGMAARVHAAMLADLQEAASGAADSTKDLRDAAKEAEKAWDRMAGKGDRNKKTIKELDDAIDKWSKRYRRAVRDNDSEEASFSLRQVQRLLEQRNLRQAQIDLLKDQKAALNALPERVSTQVLTPGLTGALGKVTGLKDAFHDLPKTVRTEVITSIRESRFIGGGSNAPHPGGWDNDVRTPWPQARGGWAPAGALTLSGEYGRELRIEPRSGLRLDAQKTARILEQGTSGPRLLNLTVNVNAGAFMGSQIEATRYAQAVAPVVGREMQRLGLLS